MNSILFKILVVLSGSLPLSSLGTHLPSKASVQEREIKSLENFASAIWLEATGHKNLEGVTIKMTDSDGHVISMTPNH